MDIRPFPSTFVRHAWQVIQIFPCFQNSGSPCPRPRHTEGPMVKGRTWSTADRTSGAGVQSGYATSLGSAGDATLHQRNSWEDHWETPLVSQPVLLCKPPARHLWEERVWCENPAVRGGRRDGLAEPSGLLVTCESWWFSLEKKQQGSREGKEISNLCNFQILGQNYFLIWEETVGKDVLLWYSYFIKQHKQTFR